MNVKNLFKKRNDKESEYFMQKELNKKYLVRQNLIFVFIAVIIIIIVSIFIYKSLFFLLGEIDRGFRYDNDEVLENINLDGLNQIKEKVSRIISDSSHSITEESFSSE